MLLQEKESLTTLETLVSILNESNNTVLRLFSRLEDDGYVIPQEGILLYNQALSFANESKNLFQEGNYPEAEAKIIESLNKFEEALSITYAIIDDPNTQRLTFQEKNNQIKSSIDRYNELVRKFSNLTKLATQAGFNTIIIQDKIQEIISLLIKASNNLEQNRFEIALRNLAEIKVLADQINNSLKNFAEQLKTTRLETYIEKTEVRLDVIKRTTVSLASNYPTSTIDAALSAIESAKSSLNNAKEYLQINQLSDTLIELANSKESEEQAINYLKSEDSTIDSSLSHESSQINTP